MVNAKMNTGDCSSFMYLSFFLLMFLYCRILITLLTEMQRGKFS